MNKSNHHKDVTSVADFRQMKITSPVFSSNDFIPAKYSCDGENISPPLEIEGIPENAKCLAIIADDPDAPVGTWVHWVAWNIPVTHFIKEDSLHGKQGINDFQLNRYSGPCPPNGKTHHYFFKIYALDDLLNLPPKTTKHALEKAMSNHILAFGELVGSYKRK